MSQNSSTKSEIAVDEPATKRSKIEGGFGGANGGVENGQELDEKAQKALELIDKQQNELDILNEKSSEEILLVEQKYNLIRKPIYEKREKIIEQIPYFWSTVLFNHPQLGLVIDADDEDALQYLTKVSVSESEDIKSGYKITFCFDSQNNKYFSNKELVKEFTFTGNSPNQEQTPDNASSKSTSITWKEGHNLLAKKSIANSGDKSFFTWFQDNSDPTSDDVAEIIRDEIWPNPLQYFLIPADAHIAEGEEDDEDEDEEEEEEDSEEEEGIENLNDQTTKNNEKKKEKSTKSGENGSTGSATSK